MAKKIIFTCILVLFLASCKKQEKDSYVEDFQLSITYFSGWWDIPFTLIVNSHNKEHTISILSTGIWEEICPPFPPAVFEVSEKDMAEFYDKLYKLDLYTLQREDDFKDICICEKPNGFITFHNYKGDTCKLCNMYADEREEKFQELSILLFNLADKYIKNDPYASAIETTERRFKFSKGFKLISTSPYHLRIYSQNNDSGYNELKKVLKSISGKEKIIIDLSNARRFLPYADLLRIFAERNHNILWVISDSIYNWSVVREECGMVPNILFQQLLQTCHDSCRTFKDIKDAYKEASKNDIVLFPYLTEELKTESLFNRYEYHSAGQPVPVPDADIKVPRDGKLVRVPDLVPVPEVEIKEDTEDSNKQVNPDTNQKLKEVQENDSLKKRK